MVDFEQIGLTNRDRRVYEALVQIPRSSIRRLAEATNINRGSVYESVKDLRAAGLVSQITVGKSLRYSAADPEKLQELVNEKRHNLVEMQHSLAAYIESLGQYTHQSGFKQFASFYDGDEGLANILRDVLTTCRTENINQYRAISSPKVSEYLYNNFAQFTREREKQGLFVKVLRQGKPLRPLSDKALSKMLPEQYVDSQNYVLIYGSKLAIVSLDDTNHTSGIIISNRGISQLHAQLFDIVWATSPQFWSSLL